MCKREESGECSGLAGHMRIAVCSFRAGAPHPAYVRPAPAQVRACMPLKLPLTCMHSRLKSERLRHAGT
jgi:hypothetical protein